MKINYNNEILKRLDTIIELLKPEVSGLEKSTSIINISQEPSIPSGYNWTIESHRKVDTVDLSKMSLHLLDEQKNGYIEGDELRKELESKNILNANVLDYLLENPNFIPEEWKGKYIFFWGTVYRRSDGRLCVRCLCFGGDSWDWRCRWLGRGFLSSAPAAPRRLQASKPFVLGFLGPF